MPEEEFDLAYWQGQSVSEDGVERAGALFELGRYYSDFSQDEAIGYYGSALDIYTELDRPVEQAHAVRSLAEIFVKQGRFAEGADLFLESARLSNEFGDAETKAYSLGARGDALRSLERWQEAYECHLEAAEAFKDAGDNSMVALNSILVGKILARWSRLSEAVEKFTEAYNYYQLSGHALKAAHAKDELADALAELGELDEAIAHRKDVIEICTHLEEEVSRVLNQIGLGQLYIEKGNYQAAIQLLRQVEASLRADKGFSPAAQAELYLTVAKFRLDLDFYYADTQASFSRLRAFLDAEGDGVMVAKVDRFTAEWYTQQKRWLPAEALLKRVVERFQLLDEPALERSTRARWAAVLIELGDFEKASEVLAGLNPEDWGEVKAEREYLKAVKERLEAKRPIPDATSW